MARADRVRLEALPRGGSAAVVIPVSLDLASAGRAAADLIQGKPVDVRLAGRADVAGLAVPLEVRGRAPAGR